MTRTYFWQLADRLKPTKTGTFSSKAYVEAKCGASFIANAEWIFTNELMINGYIAEPFIEHGWRKMMTDFILTGGCLCGSIRYEVTGPILRSYACHCNFCKKATGAAFRSAIGVSRSSFKLSGDTLSTYKHIISEHGRVLWPSFCGKCGTGIGSTLERFPDLQVINIGTLDKPEEIEVSMHYYSDEALPWICYNLTDTVFHEHRLNADDTPATPRKV